MEAIITAFFSSPLLIAFVSVLGVKIVDYIIEHNKSKATVTQSSEARLWEQVNALRAELREERKERQKETTSLDQQKDMLFLDNAKLSARISQLEAQNASQATELESVKRERDKLQKSLEESNAYAHQKGLELSEAKVRITTLEKRLEGYEK
jgi:chromosome segregation ATPase